MEKAGLLELAVAPLTWLERSRGWRRRGLAFLYLVVALAVGVFGWNRALLERAINLFQRDAGLLDVGCCAGSKGADGEVCVAFVEHAVTRG